LPPYRATQRSNTIGGKWPINWENTRFPARSVEAPDGYSWNDNAID
jgi:hypothetical protein